MTPGASVLSLTHSASASYLHHLLTLTITMSVSWLQSACLVVLVAALCPGADGFGTQHLCGSHLVEALNMVCGDRGFYYNPQRNTNPDMMNHSERRGIVQECCENPCSLLVMEKYCN
uniref:Insulin n=1 Tax=Knipowitschia caucasica TaxID=637954 RepID=A0AAV2JDR2_KNICA